MLGKKEGAGNQTVVSYTECSPPPGGGCLLLLRGSKEMNFSGLRYIQCKDGSTHIARETEEEGKKELFFSMFVSSKTFCLSWRGCVVSAHKSRQCLLSRGVCQVTTWGL